MPRCQRHRVNGAVTVLALLLGAGAAVRGATGPENEEYDAARRLFEDYVLAKDAEPHERLEALAHIARIADRPAIAQQMMPLYQKAIRSPQVADEAVALAVAEGLALCLLKQRRPYVEIRDALRREAEGRAKSAAGVALLAVAERFSRRCREQTAAGRSLAGRRIAVSRAARPAAGELGQARAIPPPSVGGVRVKAPRSFAKARDLVVAEIEAFAVKRRVEAVHPVRGSKAPSVARASLTPRGRAARPTAHGLDDRRVAVAASARAEELSDPLRTPVAAPRASSFRVAEAARVSADKATIAALPEARGVARSAAEPMALSDSAWPAVASPVAPGAAGGEAGSAIRDAVAAAAASELAKMVKALAEQADWKARKGDHQGALRTLGTVIRDAPGTAFSAQAIQRALPIAIAGLKGNDREAILREFEPWVARLGGPRDRAQARLLVLQQRYRDGRFALARDGLKAFLAEHAGSGLAPRAGLLLGLATWRAGDRAGAIRLLRKLVQRHARHDVAPRAQFLIGYLLFAGGEQEQARKAFLRVVKDYPKSPFADRAVEFLGGEAAKRAEAEAGKQQ